MAGCWFITWDKGQQKSHSGFSADCLLVNSVVPQRCGSKLTSVLFKLILWIDILSSCEIGLSWVPLRDSGSQKPRPMVAATKQLYKWYFPSVRLSVRLSVTPFSPCSHHRIIMKFSGVITMVKSDVHAKDQGQRSKVKVTEVNTQLSRFRTLTPVWIHIWQWNHAHSWKQHRRGALWFFKVIRQISRSHGSKNRRIWPRLGVYGL